MMAAKYGLSKDEVEEYSYQRQQRAIAATQAGAFKNEIVWRYRRWPARTRVFQRMHDVLFWYGQTPDDRHAWTRLFEHLAGALHHGLGDPIACQSSGALEEKLLGMIEKASK